MKTKLILTYIISFSVILLIIYSCNNNVNIKDITPIESIRKNNFPVIIDTFKLKADKRNTSWLSTAIYKPIYIGTLLDSIRIDIHLIIKPPELIGNLDNVTNNNSTKFKYSTYYRDWLYHLKYKSCKEANINIQLDTNQIINNFNIHTEIRNPYFEAYPVIITNNDNDTIAISYGDFLPIITEVKDSLGEWRPIERPWAYGCGNGVGTIVLPPNEIVVTSVKKYYGSYKSVFRLKVGNTYSKEYIGHFNYRQFESVFNEDGEYKEEYLKMHNR